MLSQSPANCRSCACTHRSVLSTESSVDIRFSRSRSRSARSFSNPSFPLRRLPISPDHLLRYIFLFPSVVSVDALLHTGYNLPAFCYDSQPNIKPTAAPFQGTAAVILHFFRGCLLRQPPFQSFLYHSHSYPSALRFRSEIQSGVCRYYSRMASSRIREIIYFSFFSLLSSLG